MDISGGGYIGYIFQIRWIYQKLYFCRFMVEIKEAITRPTPIPIRIDATNIRADVLRNMNPTPRPMSVVPPIIHELLSSFLFILIFSFFPFRYNWVKR